MQLSKSYLARSEGEASLADLPPRTAFNLPEKVLQFGTGVLLRGLPDFFIESANRKGVFNGRIVVVKTTGSDDSAFEEQDNLYTLCTRGVGEEGLSESFMVCAVISRVLRAREDWKQVLACAHNPNLSIVISNTTEIGIQMSDDRVTDLPPASFPGKLLAFLYERYKVFQGGDASGLVIVPTELIDDNGQKLEGIILDLAYRNNLEVDFIEWLENKNRFCNSLVDRIVPGFPAHDDADIIQKRLGYQDRLLTVCEPFRLWAIAGDKDLAARIGFASVDTGLVITPDITLFRELKLRLLNGTHSFLCALSFLSGFQLTRDSVADASFSGFVRELIHQEIRPSIPGGISSELSVEFANQVIKRFANPFIDHSWLSISVQYTAKMNMRNTVLIKRYTEHFGEAPACMAICFSAYLLFMKSVRVQDGRYFGLSDASGYEIKDAAAGYFHQLWNSGLTSSDLVKTVLSNADLWETNLSALPGFCEAVTASLEQMLKKGVRGTVVDFMEAKVSL
jgi:tagaturonate reductase